MKNLLLGIMVLFAFGAFAQSIHNVDFEPAGVGADWSWIMAENADNPPLEFIANPVSGGINTSPTVAKFTARLTGAPWALCFTDSDGAFTFDATNATVTIMVYKPVISNIGIKFEGISPAVEIQIPNTLVNQWESITFDFSASIGNTYSRLVIIPDFTSRTQENIIYFDNIHVPDGVPVGPLPEPTVAAPTPTQNPANVISMFSDAYTDVPVDTWLAVWSQGGLEDILVAGNATKKYTSVNYVGIETVGPNLLDVSSMTHFHLDMWTPEANDFKIKLVDFGADAAYGGGDDTEHELTFAAPATETWISYDIPLSDFVNLNITGHMAQYIMVKAPLGIIYIDNLFFYTVGGIFTTSFNPQDGATNVPVTVSPSISFSVPVEMANGSAVTNGNIASIVTLKVTNSGGANVPFVGTINAQKDVITIDPVTNLSNGQVYYLAINDNMIKYQGGSLIVGESCTFTTLVLPTLVLYDNFEDASTLTWGFWDNNAGGILDVEATNPALIGQNTTPKVAKFTKTAGSDPYTHAFAILGGKLDLSVDNIFQLYLRSETAGTVFAAKLQNNDLIEPWTTEVTVEYTIPNANIWNLVTFNFSAYSDRTDLDKFLLLVNPGQVGAGVHYFDQVYGPAFTAPAVSPVVVDAYTTIDGSAIEVKFDKTMEPNPGNAGNFSVYVNGLINYVTSTYRKTEDNSIIVLNLTSPIGAGDDISLSYLMSGTITSLDNGILQPFANYAVTNTLVLRLDVKVLLEGPFNGFNMNAGLNPNFIPLDQPYSASPWNYNGTESVPAIPNVNVVDWVYVELRDATDASLATPGTMIAQQAAFLLRNGSIVGLDGIAGSYLTFNVSPQYGLYVVVSHRNHIDVLSAFALTQTTGIYTYNFRSGANQAYGNTQKEVITGLWGMVAGNGLQDILIDDFDKTNVWEPQSGMSGYLQGDFNMDSQVDNNDKDDYWYPNIGASGSDYQLIWQDEFDTDGPPSPDN